MSETLKVPFAITGDHAATVEQGTLEEVSQNVAVIVGTLRGERLTVSDFGISDQTFEMEAPDVAEIEAAVDLFEPRAQLDFVENGDELQVQVSL